MLDGEPLAIRAHRLLSESFDEVIAVGKASTELLLPFPIIDDGDERQAAIVGVAAALRHAEAGICVVIPTDMPALTAATLRLLAAAASADGVDAATCPLGPLPGAFRTTLAPLLDRHIAEGRLALRGALRQVACVEVECDERELLNVNTRAEFDAEKARRRN